MSVAVTRIHERRPQLQQPSAQQPGYGQPGYGYKTGRYTEGLAISALVVAIVGLLACPPIGGIVALVLANSAAKRIEASGGGRSGLGLVMSARIIAIISFMVTVISVLSYLVDGPAIYWGLYWGLLWILLEFLLAA